MVSPTQLGSCWWAGEGKVHEWLVKYDKVAAGQVKICVWLMKSRVSVAGLAVAGQGRMYGGQCGMGIARLLLGKGECVGGWRGRAGGGCC